MVEKGLVHLYTGDGKGKTTAAVGLAVRAAGAGLRVLFVQLMKGRDSAEIAPMERLGIRVMRANVGEKFVFQMDEAEKAACRAAHCACFEEATQQAQHYDVLVLDEAMGALSTGMLAEADLAGFIKQKPPGLEVVLTGRDAPDAIKELADYITDMRAERHPFEGGRAARRGIEF